MLHYSSIMRQIFTNQNKCKSSLELILQENAYQDQNVIKHGKFAQLLAIMTENTDDILAESFRLENILAFTLTFRTYHSVINLLTLNKMIDKLVEKMCSI